MFFPGSSANHARRADCHRRFESVLAKNPQTETQNTEWKLSDLKPELKLVSQHRNFAQGKQLFTTLACAQCHQLGKECAAVCTSVAVGPNLDDVVKKYKGDAKLTLREILEPSREIEEKYRSVTLELNNGTTVTGKIVAEDPKTITIQTAPPVSQALKIKRTEIETQRVSPISIMPAAQ